MWSHVIGKPVERVQLSADVTMNQRLDRELELLSRLSIQQMEAIAEDSQALVDLVIAMAQANAVAPDPAPALSAPLDSNESDGQPGEGSTSNDVDDA